MLITEISTETIAAWFKWLRSPLFVAPMEYIVKHVLSSGAPIIVGKKSLDCLNPSEVACFVRKLESLAFELDDPENDGLMLARIIAYEVAQEESDDPDDYGCADDYVEYRF